MAKYLGEEVVDIKDSPFNWHDRRDWCLYFIKRYAGIDGAHHKDWLLDQLTRILTNTPVIIKRASWDDGQYEWRATLDKPSQEYKDYVKNYCDGEDGPNTYSWIVGMAP